MIVCFRFNNDFCYILSNTITNYNSLNPFNHDDTETLSNKSAPSRTHTTIINAIYQPKGAPIRIFGADH